MFDNGRQMPKAFVANFSGDAVRFDVVDDLLGIILQDRSRFFVIDRETLSCHRLARIVNSVFERRSATNAFDHHIFIAAHEVNQGLHVDEGLQHFALSDVAGNPIENQQMFAWPEPLRITLSFEPVQKDLDRNVIRSKLATRTVLSNDPPFVGLRVQLAENHAA